jgi:hypothetical protein
LREADHALVALGVELAVVARLQAGHLREVRGGRRCRRVVFERVPEVGQEPQPVVELDLVGLVVDGRWWTRCR